MNTKKDYSLLRPFDLEAAKAWEAICWHEDGDVAINVYFIKECVIPVFEECLEDEQCWIFNYQQCNEYLRMAPLCWVEGKPVYKGDGPLYHHKQDRAGYYTFTAEYFKDGKLCLKSEPEGYLVASPENLTWTPPKVKREGWIAVQKGNPCFGYAALCSHVCATKEQAEKHYGAASVVVVRIEWEEPAGGAA